MTGRRVVSIVDYGVANLGSIRNMFARLRIDVELITTPDGVAAAKRLLLPGVGAFDHGMEALAARGLVEPLRRAARDGRTPLLGICLGMQLLSEGSEEGERPGLGVIAGRCVRLQVPPGGRLKVPHMGWNVPSVRRASPLLRGLDERARFYFTHSYHLVCEQADDVLATAVHGIEFTAMIERGAVMGMQCHPEKSHRFGMTVLRNFAEL